jgi:hypothetical protein
MILSPLWVNVSRVRAVLFQDRFVAPGKWLRQRCIAGADAAEKENEGPLFCALQPSKSGGPPPFTPSLNFQGDYALPYCP